MRSITRHPSLLVLGATLVLILLEKLDGGVAQWEFNGNLNSSTGQGPLTMLAAFPADMADVSFETEQINGQSAQVAHFSQGTYFEVPHGFPRNGGGGYVNQYTLIMDVMFPDRSPSGGLASLLQTNCCNQNNGDWFVCADDGLGVEGNCGGSVPDGEWHRLALVVDLVAGTYTSYVDGVQVQQLTGEGLDGRFALYSPADTDPAVYETFFIFADGDDIGDEPGENAEGFVNSVQFHDLALAPGVLAELGGPSAAGIPRDICILPPAVATRDFTTTRTPEETNADFLPGDLIDVKITLSDVRTANPPCTAPAGVVIVETLPAGWAPSQISDGGVHDAVMNTITWTVQGAALVNGQELLYRVTAAATPGLAATFAGTAAENIPGARPSPVRGETDLLTAVPFDACGGIRCWNLLGPYRQPAGQDGANPGNDNIQKDYLTDGAKSELDFVFFPGASIATDFGDTAASAGLFATGQADVNPGGVPTVLPWNDRDGMIVLDGDVYDMSPDQVMAYAQVYVRNTTGADLECKLGISSDDSVQVLVNGLEVWINSAGRAGSDACEPQDMTPDGFLFLDNVVLEMGENSIIVKVFEGAGDFNFALVVLDPESGDPITTGLEVSKYPEGVCPIAPVQVTRSINTQETQPVQHETLPRWSSGNTYTVSLALSDVRGANERPGCPQAAGMVTIVESAPPGWTPSAPSDGGSVNGQEVSWTLNLSGQGGGAGILNLSYGVEAPEGNGLVSLAGTISEPGNIATFAVGGTNLLLNPGTFNGEGFITRWLLLGPYSQRSGFGWGATPSEANMRMDFLTDGARSERDIAPREGDTINTVYAPAGTSPGLGISPAPCPINPGGVPTWFGWLDFDDAINFGDYYCGGIDLCMMYAVTYVYADREMSVDIGLDSDDAVQVILDGNEIWLNSVARGVGGPNTVADTIFASQTPDLMAFSAGCHKLMVKVFEGAGDHQFRLRFQDPATQLPIGDDEGLHILRDPTCSTTFVETNCTNGRDDDGDSRIDCADADCVPDAACGVSRFVRGDVDGSSVINITDGINLLNFLFLGGSRPPCMDAADVDDSGGDLPNITDAIFLLNWLFQGGTRPPPPVPSTPDYATGDCGADPPDRPDSMDCLLSPAKCRA